MQREFGSPKVHGLPQKPSRAHVRHDKFRASIQSQSSYPVCSTLLSYCMILLNFANDFIVDYEKANDF